MELTPKNDDNRPNPNSESRQMIQFSRFTSSIKIGLSEE